MASGRITIDVGLETRGVAKGAKDAEKALGDLEDAVGDTGREGGRDLDKIEDELKDVQRESERAGRNVGRNLDDGFDRAKKGADEFKREADSTAREAAASFDGSAESIGDAFQETAANALGGFGPLGAAAGIALAAGIGAGTAALTTMAEETEEVKQNITDMYKSAAEEGRAFLSEAQVQAEASRLLFDDRDRLRTEAKNLGVDVIDLARAYAGDQEAINTVIEEGNGKLETRQKKAQENLETAGDMAPVVDLEAESIRQVLALLEEEKGWHEDNKTTAQQVIESQKRGQQEYRTEVQKTQDKLKAMVAVPYNAKLNVDVNDRTSGQVDRIVRRINGKIASIQISAGIGGKQML